MDEVAVVVDASLQIVAASAPAELFGMLEGYSPRRRAARLVRSARRADGAETATLRLRRGVELRLVTARASVITRVSPSSSSATSPSTSASRRCGATSSPTRATS
jgi:two-component system sensor histidine kinase SenX3